MCSVFGLCIVNLHSLVRRMVNSWKGFDASVWNYVYRVNFNVTQCMAQNAYIILWVNKTLRSNADKKNENADNNCDTNLKFFFRVSLIPFAFRSVSNQNLILVTIGMFQMCVRGVVLRIFLFRSILCYLHMENCW